MNRRLIWRMLIVCQSIGLLAAFPLLGQEDFLDESDLFDEEFESEPTISDPLEGLNRSIFKFNDFVYLKLLGPLAKGYHDLTPDPIENGFSNFFDNLKYPIRFTSNLLQGKVKEAIHETGNFLVNSTVGFAGFHKASDDFFGPDPPVEDFGQVLGSWGVGEGFYFVIPFLGPSNGRDLLGRFWDRAAHPVLEPWTFVDDSTDRTIYGVVDFVTDSPELMYRYQLLTEAAIDPYEAMKHGFTQYRLQQIKE
ncbi:MAG: VacJ family lipoprotein [Verrucomicrobia bacterium]|nr:VacJ family lipoprotein [Verrucomicrobiota bacterium]